MQFQSVTDLKVPVVEAYFKGLIAASNGLENLGVRFKFVSAHFARLQM